MSCNLVKKSASSSQQTNDSTATRKTDSTNIKTTSSSQTDAESWWKLYALDRANQPAPVVPGEKTVYVKGDNVYIPQPYLLAEGGTKSSSSNQNTAESTHVEKFDSTAFYRQLLAEASNKSKSSFPWYWFVIGGVVLLGIGFFLPQFSISRK